MRLNGGPSPTELRDRLLLRRIPPRLGPRSRGQALVEFALVLPVMVVLLLTVLDLGRLFYSQMEITNAAREGAFQASLPATPAPGGTYDPTHAWYSGPGSTCSSTTDAVTCRALLEFQGTPANWFVQPVPSGVTASCVGSSAGTSPGTPPCPSGMGNQAAVTVNTTFSLWSPWMGAFFGGHQTINLSATATSQVQTLPVGAAQVPVTPTTGSILIAKSAVGGTDTFGFTGTGSGLPASFTITTTASSSNSTTSAGSALFTNLAAGTYTVTESSQAGWSFTSLTCFTSGSHGSIGTWNGMTATISLVAGDAVICTFTNTLPETTCTVPSAAFSANGTPATATDSGSLTGSSPFQVTFLDTSSPGCSIASWRWQFGSGNSNTYVGQTPPTQTFLAQNKNQDGVYVVTLTVTNSAGTSQAAMTITATATP